MGKHGGDRKSEEVKNQDANMHLDNADNNRPYKSSLNPDYLLDRIERDYPDTYQDIKAGDLILHRVSVVYLVYSTSTW